MKTRLAILALLAVTLSACQQSPAPRAIGVRPVAPLIRGCRFIATWGAPEVHWMDTLNGHRWTCSYQEFFRYCGGKHPNALGIAVKGKLPAEITAPAQDQPATESETPEPTQAMVTAPPECEPPPSILYKPVYSTPQSQR